MKIKLEAATRLKTSQGNTLTAALVADKVAISVLKEISSSKEFKELKKNVNTTTQTLVVEGDINAVKKALASLGWTKPIGKVLPKEFVVSQVDWQWPLRVVYQSSTNRVRIVCVADAITRTPLLKSEIRQLEAAFGDLKIDVTAQHSAVVGLTTTLPLLTFLERASKLGYVESASPIDAMRNDICLSSKITGSLSAFMYVIEGAKVVKGFNLCIIRTKR